MKKKTTTKRLHNKYTVKYTFEKRLWALRKNITFALHDMCCMCIIVYTVDMIQITMAQWPNTKGTTKKKKTSANRIIFVDRKMFNIKFYERHKCNFTESDILSST